MALLLSLMLVTLVTLPIRGQYSGHVIFPDESEPHSSKIVREASCSLIVNGEYLSSYKVRVANILNMILQRALLQGDRAWTSN